MSAVKLCLYVSECVCSKIITELPGLVGGGTHFHKLEVLKHNSTIKRAPKQLF